jgi:HK97 family phage portal protein
MFNLNDPNLLELIRHGTVTLDGAMKNSAVFRSVDLITGAVGALPLPLMSRAGQSPAEAVNHPLHAVLMLKPNAWQSPFEFKRLMQHWVLLHGNAYALIVRSLGRVVALQPIHPDRVDVTQRGDFSLLYRVSRPNGVSSEHESGDVLHLRGPSEDGVKGLSRVKHAAEIIEIGVKSQLAIARIFENGMMVGGILKHPKTLSPESYERLKASMERRHAGPENAGRWIIAEEGLDASPFAQTAVDAQLTEVRAAMVEDIGRVFGVPRPLLGVDDTSWGSGIEQLAILFVRFGLAPWFKAWEDAISVSCLTQAERGVYYADFQERELLRGTIKDQFEAYARAAGAGGHKPWMTGNEIRDDLGMAPHPDGETLMSAREMSAQTAQPAPAADILAGIREGMLQ